MSYKQCQVEVPFFVPTLSLVFSVMNSQSKFQFCAHFARNKKFCHQSQSKKMSPNEVFSIIFSALAGQEIPMESRRCEGNLSKSAIWTPKVSVINRYVAIISGLFRVVWGLGIREIDAIGLKI